MISEKLIQIRNKENLTQEQMAKKLKVSRSTYSVWETGRDIIPLKHLNNFSNIFDVSLDYLIGNYNVNNSDFKHINLDKKQIGIRLKTIRNKNHLIEVDFRRTYTLYAMQAEIYTFNSKEGRKIGDKLMEFRN